MAAEVPVSDVLCEAMEYLSKLGSNLRIRSENLKEKRIRKDKLRNAHAVHKAANKVLLICELSKKSLENVETGVRKVLSIVDASQAHSESGGKLLDKKKQERDEKFYHFEFESHKLRISKKIPIKHFMSVKVLAKSIPASMQEKYPVFYDCKLKRRRIKSTEKQNSEKSLNRKSSVSDSDTNQKIEKSKEKQKESVNVIESDASESEKCNKDSRKKSVDYDKSKTDRRKSLDVISNSEADNVSSEKANERGAADSLEIQDDASQCELDKNEQNNMNLVNSEKKSEPEKHKSKEDLAVSDLIQCLNEARVEDSLSNEKDCNIKRSQNTNDHRTNFEKHKRGKNEANSIRKKFSKIKIVDDSSESDEESLKKEHEKSTLNENQSPSGKENESNFKKNVTEFEPKSKKMKLADVDDDSKSKEDSDHNSMDSKVSENDQKELDDGSKPLIRCVNITKLLKPDIVGKKISDSSNVGQTKNNKHSKKHMSGPNCNKEQRKLSEDERVRKKNENTENSDEEFWALKRNEVKQFKPKHFTVNIERLPKLSVHFLLTHNLKKIIQGCKTISEITKEKDKDLEHSDTNINEVKNALLNDSASDDAEITVIAKAREVKQSLLNDSDSDKEEMSQVTDNNQINQEKLTDPAAIKNALLNESDSENNEQEQVQDKRKNKTLDSVTNELEQDIAETIKNALLNDSDSDKNQNKEDNDEIMPRLQETTNDDKVVEPNDTGKDNGMSQSSKEENENDTHSKTIEQNESNQDPEKIKSSLLNDSSDNKSESPVFKRKKIKFKKHKRKHAFKSMQAKKMLLNYSSSSEDEKEHSQESDKDSKHAHKQKSNNSSSSSSSQENTKELKNQDSLDSTSQEKSQAKDEDAVNKDKDNRSIDQIDGTMDEHSNSSVSKVRR